MDVAFFIQLPFSLHVVGLLQPLQGLNEPLSEYMVYLFDFVPEHFQRLRERLSGEFGSLAAFGLRFFCPADRAQYASPFDVPGRTRGPPSFALPAWP